MASSSVILTGKCACAEPEPGDSRISVTAAHPAAKAKAMSRDIRKLMLQRMPPLPGVLSPSRANQT
jgi:hypothetical protein